MEVLPPIGQGGFWPIVDVQTSATSDRYAAVADGGA